MLYCRLRRSHCSMSARTLVTFISIFFFFQDAVGISIISRKEWNARPPKSIVRIPNNLPYVVIHHSAVPAACYTPTDCKEKMKSMQIFHQDDRGWGDIGYNFAIGGDGNIYEGRGFNVQGAHAPGYNKNGIGIVFIGNWSNAIPPKIMITRAKELIHYGVSKGHISKNYKLLGHRQVSSTECPGTALFNQIKMWPHFSNKP